MSALAITTMACSANDGRASGEGSDSIVSVSDSATEDGSDAGESEATGSASDTNETGAGPGGTDGSAAHGTKFDVGAPDGGVSCSSQGSGGAPDFSYIWIANSSQGTVSKIHTQTLVEEGRYRVRPDSSGNPSRTSVSLTGDVAVANRSGGVVKIYATSERCQESNGMPGIQTSSGATDILDWGVEECVAWYTPFSYATQRPVAWTQGEWNEGTCTWENQKLWTSGGNNGGTADVVLMDGDTGVVEDMVSIPNVIGWAQLYGGAVDAEGDFWTVDHNWSGASTLIRVRRSDLDYDTWPVTGNVHYGLAVDSMGRAWLCGSGGASRFDPVGETWTHLAPMSGGSALGGCMEDANGILWNSAYPNGTLVGIDTQTVQVVQTITIPEYVHGVSIDFEGYVWGVSFAGSNAYRIDVETEEIDTVTGLVGAYTYSDMTGFALSAVGGPTG
jgi:hypothetical protein